MVRSLTVTSQKTNKENLVAEITQKIRDVGKEPILIVFTAEYESFYYVATNLKKNFPLAITIGTTSYLNFTNTFFSHNGASAMAIFSGIECAEGVLFEINKHPSNYIMHLRNAVNSLSTYENTCCLEFNTAFSNSEELVMDTFRLGFEGKPITVFGGSSGAGLEWQKDALVSLNGEVYLNTCVFCLIHNTEGRIFYYKEDIYKPTNNVFLTTDVDCEERTIYELNNKPAVDVISDALKISIDELSENVDSYPLGRLYKDKYYITNIGKINSDGSIKCFANIFNRSKVVLLQLDDIEKVWKETIEKTKTSISQKGFTFVVNCMGRTMLFKKNNNLDKYLDLLKNNYQPYIGLSGYGEQLDFQHFNNTMILAIFE